MAEHYRKTQTGISREQAEAGLGPLWSSIRSDELKEIKGGSEKFREHFVAKSRLLVLDGARGFSPLRSDVQMPLLIVMGMVGLVALMACANVGSLLLVRAAGRIREMSVRYALGAKRKRVVQQLLVEGLLLGLAGGLFGMLLAPRVSALLINMIWSGGTGDLPFSAKPDLRIMLFNCALALFATLLFSLAPAAQFWRPDLAPALKQQGMTARSGPLRFRRVSVALQIGLSLMMLVAAGLFVRTLHNLKSLNAGFATDHLLTFRIDPRMAGYEPARTFALYQRVVETLKGLPGVRSVGATDDPELANDNETGNITIAGYTEKPDEDMNVEQPNVSPDYFSSLQMPILAGRGFTEQDSVGSQKVAVVNESFAHHFFGDPQQALGHSLGKGGGTGVKTDIAIVGVVKDAKHTSLREPVTRTVFVPYLQSAEPRAMTFYVRTWQPPESAENTIRRAMQTLDSNLVLDTFRTMDEQIDNNLIAERVIALLASGFGVLAALMAAVGLYGVLAYSTTQRTSEIGIRMALGATRGSVVRMVMFEVVWLAGISIAVDVAGVVAADERGEEPVVWDFEQRPADAGFDDCGGDVVATGIGVAAGATSSTGRADEGVALRVGGSRRERISTGFAFAIAAVCENAGAHRGRRHYHRARSGSEHGSVLGGQWRTAESFALSAARATGDAAREQAKF